MAKLKKILCKLKEMYVINWIKIELNFDCYRIGFIVYF